MLGFRLASEGFLNHLLLNLIIENPLIFKEKKYDLIRFRSIYLQTITLVVEWVVRNKNNPSKSI